MRTLIDFNAYGLCKQFIDMCHPKNPVSGLFEVTFVSRCVDFSTWMYTLTGPKGTMDQIVFQFMIFSENWQNIGLAHF